MDKQPKDVEIRMRVDGHSGRWKISLNHLNTAKMAIAGLVLASIALLYLTQGWDGIVDKISSIILYGGLTALGLDQLIKRMNGHETKKHE